MEPTSRSKSPGAEDNISNFVLNKLHVLLGMALLAIPTSCAAPSEHDRGEAEPALQKFMSSPNIASAAEALYKWEDCAGQREESIHVCHEWDGDKIAFKLVSIGERSLTTPAIESKRLGNRRVGRVVIHLTGGPDLPPFATESDNRSKPLSEFHDQNFTLVSVGYWGTSVRTVFEDGEIVLAAQDFENILRNYRIECGCEPLVIAESLGANILFYYLNENPNSKVQFLAVSPAIMGITHAVESIEDHRQPSDLNVNSRSSILYSRNNDGSFVRVGFRLINSFEHLRRFAEGQDTTIPTIQTEYGCSKILIGRDDELNAGLDRNHDRRITSIDKAGHDLYEDQPLVVQSILREFIQCAT